MIKFAGIYIEMCYKKMIFRNQKSKNVVYCDSLCQWMSLPGRYYFLYDNKRNGLM